jgi:hypothetical protein
MMNKRDACGLRLCRPFRAKRIINERDPGVAHKALTPGCCLPPLRSEEPHRLPQLVLTISVAGARKTFTPGYCLYMATR